MQAGRPAQTLDPKFEKSNAVKGLRIPVRAAKDAPMLRK